MSIDDDASAGATNPSGAVDEVLERRAEEICARLLIYTYVPKRQYRDLLLDDALRDRVRARLGQVGLELVESFTSDYFGVRLKPDVEADVAFDWSSNLRLPRGAVALIVICWAKLVLPRRLALEADKALPPAQQTLFEHAPETTTLDAAEKPAMPARKINVHRDALYAEFGAKFGKTAFQRYLGMLRNAGFVLEDREGRIAEGPLLDLLVDGTQMAGKLKDSVLWDLLGTDRAREQALDGLVTSTPKEEDAGEGELPFEPTDNEE